MDAGTVKIVNDSDSKTPTPAWSNAWAEQSEKVAKLQSEAMDGFVLAWCKYEDGHFKLSAQHLRKAANAAYEYADALATAASILES